MCVKLAFLTLKKINRLKFGPKRQEAGENFGSFTVYTLHQILG
jgi:hypothetical protein